MKFILSVFICLSFFVLSPSESIGLEFEKLDNFTLKSITVSYLELNGNLVIKNTQLLDSGRISSSKGIALYFDDILVDSINIVPTKIKKDPYIIIPLNTTLINYNQVYDKHYKNKDLGFVKQVKDKQEAKVINLGLKGELTVSYKTKNTTIKIDDIIQLPLE